MVQRQYIIASMTFHHAAWHLARSLSWKEEAMEVQMPFFKVYGTDGCREYVSFSFLVVYLKKNSWREPNASVPPGVRCIVGHPLSGPKDDSRFQHFMISSLLPFLQYTQRRDTRGLHNNMCTYKKQQGDRAYFFLTLKRIFSWWFPRRWGWKQLIKLWVRWKPLSLF